MKQKPTVKAINRKSIKRWVKRLKELTGRLKNEDELQEIMEFLNSPSRLYLIAAAPELLETLESVVKVCDDLGRDGVFSHVMAQARAAIAKATGEKQ